MDFSYERRDHVAWLRLSRPRHGNRLTPAMAEELLSVCEALEEDEDIMLVLLTGAGDVFCQGLEYPSTQQGATAAQEVRAQFGSLQCIAALAALTKPTIAAVNGDALGVGMELALACDLRLAVTGARFGLPQVAAGMIPCAGGTQRLPRIVGQAKALELVLTGMLVDATEARRIGLVSEVSEPTTFATDIDQVLTGLLAKGPIALRLGKEAVHKALDLTLDQGMRLEEDLYALLQTTRDRAEGVQAFLHKRKSVFTGQ
jgi:enoyl-CoA hydratase/carnithine racemase